MASRHRYGADARGYARSGLTDSAACFAPVFLIGANPWRVGGVSGSAKPIACDATAGSGLDAVPGSGTMERQEDGYVQHGAAWRMSLVGLRSQRVWPGMRRAGLPRPSLAQTPRPARSQRHHDYGDRVPQADSPRARPRCCGDGSDLRDRRARCLVTHLVTQHAKGHVASGWLVAVTWSGWPDLNRRPLRPERSALPSCATPRRPRRESSRFAAPA